VGYQLPHRSRRIQNIPPVTFEPPQPPRRRILDIAGYFEIIGSIDFFGELDLTKNIASALITMRVEDIQTKGFVTPFNPILTRDNTPVVVPIPDPGERANTLYRICRGLVMDELTPTVE